MKQAAFFLALLLSACGGGAGSNSGADPVNAQPELSVSSSESAPVSDQASSSSAAPQPTPAQPVNHSSEQPTQAMQLTPNEAVHQEFQQLYEATPEEAKHEVGDLMVEADNIFQMRDHMDLTDSTNAQTHAILVCHYYADKAHADWRLSTPNPTISEAQDQLLILKEKLARCEDLKQSYLTAESLAYYQKVPLSVPVLAPSAAN